MYIFTYLSPIYNPVTMNVFYSSEIDDHKITLRDQEAHHCTRVMRKVVGDEIYITDGRGYRYLASLTSINRKEVIVKIQQKEYSEGPTGLPHLAFGLVKSSTRLEWLLEKVTESGVSRITPLICTRTERNRVNSDRMMKIIVSAMKQSLRYYLPVLDSPMKFDEFMKLDHGVERFIASFGPGNPQLAHVKTASDFPVIVIGPEGDFTSDELNSAENSKFKRVNLGEFRLRTETAAIVATTLIGQANLSEKK